MITIQKFISLVGLLLCILMLSCLGGDVQPNVGFRVDNISTIRIRNAKIVVDNVGKDPNRPSNIIDTIEYGAIPASESRKVEYDASKTKNVEGYYRLFVTFDNGKELKIDFRGFDHGQDVNADHLYLFRVTENSIERLN